MSPTRTLKLLLKRGALVTAANWQVVAIMFVADALFKTLLVVPIVSGVLLVALLAGGDPTELLHLSPSRVLPAMAQVLLAQPAALVAFLIAIGLVLTGGALLMVLAKGGAITILIAGERAAGAIEHPPLRMATLARAARFSLERFTRGSEHLLGRYVALAACQAVVYAVSLTAYLAVVFGGSAGDGDWPLVAAIASTTFVVWITFVNLVYLLFQIVIAAADCATGAAARQVWQLMSREPALIASVFGATLVLVVLTTAGSILATAALGLIAFVPLVGLAALPLQLVAWLIRGVVFQFINLTALTAYLRLYGLALETDTDSNGVANPIAPIPPT